MSQELLQTLTSKYTKSKLPDIQPGDTVRVHQKIREGSKERVQVFEGLVIRRNSGNGVSGSILVRRIASGVGVERLFLLNSPKIVRIDITKRAKVRRAYLSYMRARTGKAARLASQRFERVEMSLVDEPPVAEAEEIPADAPSETDMPAEEPSDAEVTELSTDEDVKEAEVSIEELVQEENAEAEIEGEGKRSEQDENELANEETEIGLAEADKDALSPVERTAGESVSADAELDPDEVKPKKDPKDLDSTNIEAL